MGVRLSLGATLLLASLARAATTTCLTETFTLDDQRAFAALRSATETACPCDAFTSRGAYQRCARGVIDGAAASAALRADCVRTARDIAKGASCGTRRVPCGRVRLRDLAVDCRLSGAASCRDNGSFVRTACAAQTHCADVVEWTAGTCFDVRKFGPFTPGYRAMQYTKDSVASPGTPRVIDTAVWYPAVAGSTPIAANTGGVADATLDPGGAPYPLVLFSHGLCGYPRQSKFLTALLASHGFIVVAPSHPGNTIFDSNCMSSASISASIVERPQDVLFVLDQVVAANHDPSSPFFGRIDESRIAMTGHSFGGLTTYLVSAIEPRIKVAVPMAPAALAASTLSVPSLTMLGNIDTVISNPLARQAYARSASPKLLVEIEHAGHSAFSDFCFAVSNCNPPITLTPDEAHLRVLRFVLPFLKVYLAGDARWMPLLEPPAQPGFLYTAG